MANSLADQDGAGHVKLLQDRRVIFRHKAGQRFGTHFGGDAFAVAIVFDGDGDAMQGTAIAAGGEFTVGLFSGGQGQIDRQSRVGLQRRLRLAGARERRLGQGDRCRFAPADGGGRFADGQMDQSA